jgi:hypothetical protein
MMTDVHYDRDLHDALWSVGEGQVLHHSGDAPPPRGWAYVDHAYMAPEIETHFTVLYHAHLIGWTGHANPDGNPVHLTPDSGVDRLSDWNSEHPTGSAA